MTNKITFSPRVNGNLMSKYRMPRHVLMEVILIDLKRLSGTPNQKVACNTSCT
jgi:hypothetical protein